MLLCTYICKYFHYCSDVGPTDDDADSDPGTLYKFCMHTYTYVILKTLKYVMNFCIFKLLYKSDLCTLAVYHKREQIHWVKLAQFLCFPGTP